MMMIDDDGVGVGIETVSRVGEREGKRGIQRRKHLCLFASHGSFEFDRDIIKSSLEINHRTSGCPVVPARGHVTSPSLVLWSTSTPRYFIITRNGIAIC